MAVDDARVKAEMLKLILKMPKLIAKTPKLIAIQNIS